MKARDDEFYMREALSLAEEAAAEGETPVGAIVVRNDGLIAGRGRNRRETGRNALYHAEMLAVDEACRTLGGWRLTGCTLYVTLEPCIMCSGAILGSRIDRVVFAAYDRSGQGSGSLTELAKHGYTGGLPIAGGVLESESDKLLKKFFSELRRKRKMSRINFAEVKTEAQICAAAALADEIWHEWFPIILSAEQIDFMVEKFQSVRAMTEQIVSEGYRYYLLLRDGVKVGYTAIRREDDGRLFLSKLYIKKEYRGNGYARETFEFLKNYCRDNGLNAIWLTVNKYNAPSIAVYEKCGFRRIGDGVTDIGNGFVMDDYYFQLDVQ